MRTTHRQTPRCAFFSKSLAKSIFLLTDAQLAALPQLTLEGDAAKRSGVAIGSNPKITLVTSGACLAAAVARFGSEAALAAEAAKRFAAADAKLQAKEDEKRAAHHMSPPYAPVTRKETCNFPHLNQAGGVYTRDPAFGLRFCPPLNWTPEDEYDDDDDFGCG